MNNIEKLAIEHGSTCYTGQEYHFERWQLEAFAKALQSSEPVGTVKKYKKWERISASDAIHGGLGYSEGHISRDVTEVTWITKSPADGTKLFTNPPASVPLEKYNKLEQQLSELTDAYLLMRTGLNCLSDKAITGNQADILLGSEIPDFINYKERMRDIGSWEKLLTLAKGDWVKQAIAEAEAEEKEG